MSEFDRTPTHYHAKAMSLQSLCAYCTVCVVVGPLPPCFPVWQAWWACHCHSGLPVRCLLGGRHIHTASSCRHSPCWPLCPPQARVTSIISQGAEQSQGVLSCSPLNLIRSSEVTASQAGRGTWMPAGGERRVMGHLSSNGWHLVATVRNCLAVFYGSVWLICSETIPFSSDD